MDITAIIICILFGIACAIIHKKKGYSIFTGFLWGLFFSFIGLAVVLLEKTKEEKEQQGKTGLSLGQWLAIFLGAGILLIIFFFIIITHT